MKILLYLVLAVALIVIAFFAWFFLVFSKVDELEIPESATEPERLALIDQYLDKLQKDGKFNGAVLIARNHEPLLMKTYGYTDASLTEELTTNSSFRLASVSKQFTAAGILRAQQLNLLDIDQPVADYLTGFPYPGVTIRHLLNQTGGVPDNYMRLAQKEEEQPEGTLTISDVVRLVTEEKEAPANEPGAVFAYSNTNYVLLAGIIEAVSSSSFEDFMRRELFQLLGMEYTRIWNLVSPDHTFPGKTESFRLIGPEPTALKPSFLDGVAGDGAVFASISDFLIWDRFWSGNNLTDDSLIRQAFQPPTLNDGTQSDYCFGWMQQEGGIYWHNGAWLGARTFTARNHDKGTAFVLLDNSENVRMDDIAKKVGKVWRGME